MIRVGRIALGGVRGHKSGSPQTDKCSVIMVVPVAPGPGGGLAAHAPRVYTAWRGERGVSEAGTPRGAAWRRRLVWPSRTSRLPSGPRAQSQGGLSPFITRAYESSPGKYVAIKISKPSLSAMNIMQIIYGLSACCHRAGSRQHMPPWLLPRPGPLRAKLRADCEARGLWAPGVPGARPRISLLYRPRHHFTVSNLIPHLFGGLLRAKLEDEDWGGGRNFGENWNQRDKLGPEGNTGRGLLAARRNFCDLSLSSNSRNPCLPKLDLHSENPDHRKVPKSTTLSTGTGIRCPSSLKTCLLIADNRLTANCRNRPTI